MASKIGTFFFTILISPNESRLRCGWRLLIHACILLTLLLLTSIPLAILAFTGLNINNIDLTLGSAISLIAITLSIYLSRHVLDKRSFVSLGLQIKHQMVKDLLVGTTIPGLMMGFIFLIEWSFGWLTVESFAWNSISSTQVFISTFSVFILYVAVAWQEELLSRGYHLQNLIDGINVPWGVIISSFVFSMLHLFNPHASFFSFLGIFLAGIFLSYAYLRTRQLWLPIGLHLGWNFFQGPVFGFPVSGTNNFTIINQAAIGPELITGGQFGPEAGLLLLPSLIIGTIIIHYYCQSRIQKNHKL